MALVTHDESSYVVDMFAANGAEFTTRFQDAWEKLTNNGVNADNEPWVMTTEEPTDAPTAMPGGGTADSEGSAAASGLFGLEKGAGAAVLAVVIVVPLCCILVPVLICCCGCAACGVAAAGSKKKEDPDTPTTAPSNAEKGAAPMAAKSGKGPSVTSSSYASSSYASSSSSGSASGSSSS